ncbi:histone-lysine N-methyltransferase SETD1B-like [Sesamum indicum]|uniref:Histone-lysine N-methyltransferase SETD1B-like n=2 Tax=Sesamum TaxID=4181 RepID=A0A6I9UTR8_SESIN|nr:histone-lysine N-methyltransferase SETD1B-like [Sesamum indicum]
MKLSKSILGPVRATRNGGAVSLSFFSRRLRLRSNGSQRSPFFRKKRGGAFENHEPSSPKVTCIGQVRVKSKKKASLSARRIGEVSFRKMEQSHQPPQQECLRHRNQRWVHLPISFCEALRAFGAEFSCLFGPCKSSCFSNKAEKKRRYADENGCGAVFARWLVSVNDAEGGQRREIELVVGGGGDEAETAQRMTMRSSRRHVFEDIEVKDDRIEVKGQSLEGEEEEEEAGRVSICIPPKNALLLMRCRSDPMKMADLAHRFSWDANAAPRHEDEDFDEEISHVVGLEEQEEEVRGLCQGEDKTLSAVKEGKDVGVSEQEIQNEAEPNMEMEEKEQESLVEEEKEEVESNMSSFEALLDQENAEQYEDCPIQVEESPVLRLQLSSPQESGKETIEVVAVLPEDEAAMQKEKQQETEESIATERETPFLNNIEQKPEPAKTHQEDAKQEQKAIEAIKTPENQELAISNQETKKEEKESPALPECLLLMMREPKLSMEVSKETWVCGTDFIRWLPERPRKAAKSTKTSGCHHDQVKKRPTTIDPKPNKPSLPPPPTKKNDLQPPRSSCSLPAASMANMIEQKLVNGGGAHEPSALTRCKSEPMRTAAAKLMPESCNASTKMEAHRRASLGVGVGAAGVGF